MGQRPIRGQDHVRRLRCTAVDDDLQIVRGVESLGTRLVAVDQDPWRRPARRRPGRFPGDSRGPRPSGTRSSARRSRRRPAAGVKIVVSNSRCRRFSGTLWVTNTPPGSRTARGQLSRKGRYASRTFSVGRAVHVLQAQAEQQVEHLLVLLDRVLGQFGQLVVAQDEMDPLGELIFSRATSSSMVCDMQPPFCG